MLSYALLSIEPQLGLGGTCPKPRKLRAASARIAPPATIVACTITGERTFGMTRLNKMRVVLVPIDRDDSTKDSSRTTSVRARASRTKAGAKTIESAIVALLR